MSKKKYKEEDNENSKIPIPKGRQVICIVKEVLGWAHARVYCFDGKERICRVPKKVSTNVWLKENTYVLVDPWEIESDKKGDIIYTYSDNEVEWLKKNGYIKIQDEI